MNQQYKEYRVHVHAFDVVQLKARNDDEALKKAKAKLKLRPGYTIETRQKCRTPNCPNLTEFPIGAPEEYCRSCQYDAEERRINSPG